MKLTCFVLAGCPYCAAAREIIGELRAEHPEYAGIEIELIDERREPETAASYEYYYVPSFFLGREKLYEADPAMPRDEVKRRLAGMLDALTR